MTTESLGSDTVDSQYEEALFQSPRRRRRYKRTQRRLSETLTVDENVSAPIGLTSDRVASGCKRNFPRGTQPRTRVGRVCMRRETRGSSERAKYVSSRPVQGTAAKQDVKEIIVSRKCLSLAEKTDDRVLEVSLSLSLFLSLPSSVQPRSLCFFSLCPPASPSLAPPAGAPRWVRSSYRDDVYRASRETALGGDRR